MGVPPLNDLESAEGSNISLNHLIRTEVRAAVKAEVRATISAPPPPAYDSFPSSPSAHECETLPQLIPTDSTQLTQRPIGWPRILLALTPWLLLLAALPSLCLTVDKTGISALAFSLVLISYAVFCVVLIILALALKRTFATSKTVPSPDSRIQAFSFVIWLSWHACFATALFGWVLYWHFFLKKGSIGGLYSEARQFEGLLGINGATGILVKCLQGRTGGGGGVVKMGDLDACFAGLGVGS